MTYFPMPARVVVLQKPNVIRNQEQYFRTFLMNAIPHVDVQLACSPDELTAGTSAEVVITPIVEWLDQALERIAGLKWIHFLSAGVDRIWEMSLCKKNVLMSKSSGVHAVPISEYVLGMMLTVVKKLDTFREQQRMHQWQRYWLEELAGKTIGILGLGNVGREIARKAGAFQMHVWGVSRRNCAVDHVDRIFPLTAWHDMLGEVDFLVVALPLTDQTAGIVGEDVFRRMSCNTWLINVSRGGVVDEQALLRRLQAGSLAGAILDVFGDEPLGAEHPFWTLPNVLLTPHVSGTSDRYMMRAMEVFLQNLRQLTKHGQLVTPVDVAAGY